MFRGLRNFKWRLPGSQVVRIPGLQARPPGGGTSIGTEILLAFKRGSAGGLKRVENNLQSDSFLPGHFLARSREIGMFQTEVWDLQIKIRARFRGPIRSTESTPERHGF